LAALFRLRSADLIILFAHTNVRTNTRAVP